MNQILLGNYINLYYQQHSKSLIEKYSNKTVKHNISTTLIEQSLIDNMFQAFSALYHSAFALHGGTLLRKNSTKKQLHRFATSVVTLLK